MSNEQVCLRLDLIAAKAKQLADDVRNGKLWDGELSRVIAEIREQVNKAAQETERR